MLALIDSFTFELNNTDIQEIQHKLSFDYTTQKRLGNHQHTQATGAWEESVSFEGKLIMKSVNLLKAFEELAKKKKALRLTLGTGESYMVNINELSRTKSGFLKDGKSRYQEYSILMQRYFK